MTLPTIRWAVKMLVFAIANATLSISIEEIQALSKRLGEP